MSGEFFAAQRASEPVFVEHLIWFVGHPAVWFTLLAWALCAVGAFKLGRLIKRRYGAKWFGAYVLALVLLSAVYAMVLKSAYEVFVQGAAFSNDLLLLSWMSLALNVLAIGSVGWIISDFLRRDRG